MAAGLRTVLVEGPDAMQAAAAAGQLVLPGEQQDTCIAFRAVLDQALVADWGTGRTADDPGH